MLGQRLGCTGLARSVQSCVEIGGNVVELRSQKGSVPDWSAGDPSCLNDLDGWHSGTHVAVTTHSDTFVQQINNLMHLYVHPRRTDMMRELGYEIEDLINPEMVKAYEFCQIKDRTITVELEQRTEGYVVPSLNETLSELAQETISLDEESDD